MCSVDVEPSTFPRLTLYIPTFARYQQCLDQVAAAARLAREHGLLPFIIVAINGDRSYDQEKLSEAGADIVILRRVNLGGNANISLGYEWIDSGDYLWILSDDDSLQPDGFADLAAAMRQGVDLIVGSRSVSQNRLITRDIDNQLLHSGAALDLISASIVRAQCLRGLAPVAFDQIISSYPHTGILLSAIRRGMINTAQIIPLARLVDDSSSIAAVQGSRKEAGDNQGQQFFGGGLNASMDYPAKFNGHAFNSWWKAHWHRASMYRRSHSQQQIWVDRMAKGSLISCAWWLMSLPPYWRIKDRIRPRETA